MKLLEMNHISKAFSGTKVLDDVTLHVETGEIHALLGENGAGKSTLMNILTGVLQSDSGTVNFNGKTYPLPTIKQMEDAGIAFVHQELDVINGLSVSDNVFLGREITNKLGLIDDKEQVERTKALFERLGVDIDPRAMVSDLKVSEKQLLEICRALYADAKLIILDEPTTALSNKEIDLLFGILGRQKAEGKSFIFISHKMPEIFEISDRYTVLRNGQFVDSGLISDTDPHSVTMKMVGTTLMNEDSYEAREISDEVILELKDFSGEGFTNVDLKVHKGEVVAFTGLAGCGASELMQTIFGALKSTGGSCKVKGKELKGAILPNMKDSVAMLPSNRAENSVVPDMTILENFYLAEHELSANKPFIDLDLEHSRFAALKEKLKIKTDDPDNSIGSLSGGNKQKVFLARWLNTEAELILFDNPTQGVDVGAKAEIYKLIMDLAREGKTIIINTLEIPEVQKVADRCVVLYEGRIVKTFRHEEVNEHDVMLYSTNAAGNDEEVKTI